MLARLLFLIHWAVFWWTGLTIIAFLYFGFTTEESMNIVDFALYELPPIFYAYMIGPIVIFKFIDYVITGESTAYPDDRKR